MSRKLEQDAAQNFWKCESGHQRYVFSLFETLSPSLPSCPPFFYFLSLPLSLLSLSSSALDLRVWCSSKQATAARRFGGTVVIGIAGIVRGAVSIILLTTIGHRTARQTGRQRHAADQYNKHCMKCHGFHDWRWSNANSVLVWVPLCITMTQYNFWIKN